MEPSPTAEATRFTDPCRTSPTAKTPGRLVSRNIGRRMPIVKKVGTGKDESRLITSHGVRQPFRTRLGADQYEQGHGRHGFGRTGL